MSGSPQTPTSPRGADWRAWGQGGRVGVPQKVVCETRDPTRLTTLERTSRNPSHLTLTEIVEGRVWAVLMSRCSKTSTVRTITSKRACIKGDHASTVRRTCLGPERTSLVDHCGLVARPHP